MYTLGLITVSIPLFFSHFFARFGESFIVTNSIGYFESVKVQLFLSLLVIATIEFLWKSEVSRWKLFLSWMMGGSIFIAFAYFWYEPSSLYSLIFGVGEKQHGLLFFLGIIWYAILIFSLTKEEKICLTKMSIGSGLFVAIIGLIEVIFGYNIFLGSPYETTGSWGSIRSTSTLGNPNYVAGYLLMLFPLIFLFKKGWRHTSGIILFLGILATQSVIALSLLTLYGLFRIGYRICGGRFPIFFILIICLIGTILFFLTSENDKWLSLFSRFVLMQEVGRVIVTDINTFLLGGGPDGILAIFSESSSITLREYFPESMVIDSSHNIFLDLFVKFGLFSLLSVLLFLRYQMPRIRKEAQYGVILGIIFYSLNVVTLAPLLLFALFLSLEGKD